MAFKILLAIYLIVAVAMIFFILMQRGAGAQAGSGFGGGASGTVFGSSGAGNFLSISTKWLAIAFFAISIGMGVYVSHSSKGTLDTDLGITAPNETDEPTAADPLVAPDGAALPVDPEVPAAQMPLVEDAAPAADPAMAPAVPVEVEKDKQDSDNPKD